MSEEKRVKSMWEKNTKRYVFEGKVFQGAEYM
jgi:hypothetical protein